MFPTGVLLKLSVYIDMMDEAQQTEVVELSRIAVHVLFMYEVVSVLCALRKGKIICARGVYLCSLIRFTASLLRTRCWFMYPCGPRAGFWGSAPLVIVILTRKRCRAGGRLLNDVIDWASEH